MRDKRLDIIKGMGIFSVVIGHALQRMMIISNFPEGSFYENPLFSVIYSFHMPLFMLISGYLFYGSANKYTAKEIILKRIGTLIIPVFVWSYLFNFILIAVNKINLSVFEFVFGPAGTLWFFWAVFFSTVGIVLGKKFFNDKLVFHAVISIVLLITPDIFNKEFYAFTYPFFVLGYFLKKKAYKIENINLVFNLFLFLLLLSFWDTDKYIYTTGATLLGRDNVLYVIYINIYRWAIGISGSLSFIKIIDSIIRKSKLNFDWLSGIGTKSMGIYILDSFIGSYVIQIIRLLPNYGEIGYTFLSLLISPFIMLTYVFIIQIIDKNQITSRLLLGKYYNWKHSSSLNR